MAGKVVAEAFVTLRPKLDGFADETKKFFDGAGTKLAVATAAASTAVAGFGAAAVTAFASFERGMNEVSTLLPTFTNDQLGQLQQQVLALSRNLGVLPSEVVPALYQALSAGVPPDNVLSFLELSFKGATAGAAGLETAVDALTSVVNAYGAETIDFARASDVIFTTVRLGKTDFEQLGRTLFNVIPTAASLGISFEEVGAAMATMTARGVPTSVATTQLRALMVELSRDTTKLSQTFKLVAGQSFPEFIRAGGTLSEAMNLMREEIPDNAFRNLFSSVEAANAALLISGPNAEAMAAALAEMEGAAGATDAAFERMNRGVGRAWDRIKASTSVAMISVGAAIAPVAEMVLAFVADKLPAAINKGVELLDRVRAGLEPFRAVVEDRIVPAVLGAAAAIRDTLQPVAERMAAFWREHEAQLRGPVAGAIGGVLVVAFGALAVSAGSAAVAVAAAAAPVLAIVAAAAAAGAAIWFLVSRWDELTARYPLLAQLQATAEQSFGMVAAMVRDTLIPAVRDLAQWIQTYVVPAVVWLGGVMADYVVPAVERAAMFILQTVIPAFVRLHIVVIEGLIAGFRAFAGFVGDEVVPRVVAGATAIWSAMQAVADVFQRYVWPVIEVVGGAFLRVAGWVVGNVVPAMAAIAGVVGGVLWAALSRVAGFIVGTVIPAWVAVHRVLLGAVWVAVQAVAGYIRDTLLPAWAGVTGYIVDNVVPVLQWFAMVITEYVVPAVQAVAGWIGENVLPVLAAFAEWLGGVLGPVFAAVAGFIRDQFLAAVGAVAAWFTERVFPAFAEWGAWINEHIIPALRAFAGFILEYVIPYLTIFWAVAIAGVIAGLKALAEFIVGTVVPAIADMWRWFDEHVLPVFGAVAEFITGTVAPAVAGFVEGALNVLVAAFGAVAGFITETLVPAFGAVAGFITGSVVPVFTRLWGFFTDRLLPVLRSVAEWFITQQVEGLTVLWNLLQDRVIPAFIRIWEVIRDDLLPPVRDLVSRVGTGLVAAFRGAQTAISSIMGFIQSLIDKVQSLIDKVKDLIGWVDKIPSPGDIGGAIGGAIGKLNPFAEGGAVRAGQLTLVGERGPEVFVPNTGGRIIPNDELGALGGLTLNINAPVTIQNIGDDRDHERVLADLAFATAAELRARGVV